MFASGSQLSCRLSTAEDLVICAAEGPERLKVELRLYRQQLEQVRFILPKEYCR